MGRHMLISPLSKAECLQRLRSASDKEGFFGWARTNMVARYEHDQLMRLWLRRGPEPLEQGKFFLVATCATNDLDGGAEICVDVGLSTGTHWVFAVMILTSVMFTGLFATLALWVKSSDGRVIFTGGVFVALGWSAATIWSLRRTKRDIAWEEEFLVGFIKSQTQSVVAGTE